MATVAPTLPAADLTGLQRIVVRFLPSLTDLVFLLPLFILFGILPGTKVLLGDADLGWHIRTGEWILRHHAVPTQDLYSYTKPGSPWFAWEWGWDVVFGAVHSVAGLGGIVAIHAAILGCVAVLTFRLCRRACGNDVLALVLTKVAVCGSTVHWFARPHLISWVLFLAFAHLLARAEEGRMKCLIWLPPLMLFWTNLHGSFFLGLLMVLIAAAAPWLDWMFYGGSSAAAWQRSRPFLTAAVFCGAVTLLNPYGWHLHQHVAQYLRDSKQMDLMQEFQSISFHHPAAPFFEALLILGGAALFWCLQKREWTGFLSLLLWMHLGLFAVRSVPIYLFLCTPWVGRMLADLLRSRSNRLVRAAVRFVGDASSGFGALERLERLHIASALGLLFVVASVLANRPGFVANFDSKDFPQAALKVIDEHKARRIFAPDQWSAYLIYQRSGDMKVFIDDRSDFYGAGMLERVGHILNARWDWEADLLQSSTDMVIVAPDVPVATLLKSSPRWHLVLDDKSVLAFARAGVATDKCGTAERNFSVASNGKRKLGA